MKKVLVTYASKYGATREIAERVGEVLSQSGVQAEVLSVDAVRDLSPYDVVILGSAIYVGKWHKDAKTFLLKNEKGLADREVWLFASGPTGEGDPVELIDGKRLPSDLEPVITRIQPREVTVFHGNIDPEKVNRLEKWAVKSLVKKPFGDYRNWDAISNWTISIANILRTAQLA